MTEATTDPTVSRSRRSFSVRTRITATIATLTALAMVLVGILLYTLGVRAMHDDAAHAISQEFEEFRRLHEEGVDPDTNRTFTIPGVLERFLQRNVPDDDELLVTYVDGLAVNVSAGRSRADAAWRERFLRSSTYTRTLESVLREGGTARMEADDGQEVWVSVLPLRSGPDERNGNALVIVTFFGDDHRELLGTIRAFSLASAATLLLVILLAWIQAGRLLAPIRVLRATAQDIGATDLSRRLPETGNDDVTELTRTLNQMLSRLEEGFEAQRRFLDDAGHELKTPLTVLAGHLELLDPHDPAEVVSSRDLLLDETDRMSRLVGDLILLAKARRPDFLRPEQVDVDDLTRDVMAKMRVLGDREWHLAGVASGTCRLDTQRITQALLQLADNAVKHTSVGDRISLESFRAAGAVHFRVTDTGAGIPEKDRATIFDRFARSRVRPEDEGFGLGLSIVHAIADAHGGHVQLNDLADTSFTLSVPAEEATWPTS